MGCFNDLGKFGDNVAAVSAEGLKITYNELQNFSDKIGKVIEKRTLVFCLCQNTIGSMAGYISFLSNDIVPLMVDANINDVLMNNLLDVYCPQYVYAPVQMKDSFDKYEVVFEEYNYCVLKTNFDKYYELNDDLAMLLTTSGSTGSPKLVRQSYKNILSNAQAIAQYLELNKDERPITTLPMNYTYGISIINSHVLVGATILLTTSTIVSKDFWTFLKENEATSFGGVPFTYEMLKRIRFFKMDLPSLKTMTQAGGKLSPELHKEFAQYAMDNNKHFIVMYGQTEATARMAYLPHEKALEKYGSMGIVIPGGKFALIDENGNEIDECNRVGELVYEGDNVTLGYAECGDDLAKGDERDGRLETGDMAKKDEDGYYFIVGRKKRFLKLFGNRVNLDEVDRMIKKEYDVLDCASTGTDQLMKIYITDENYIQKVTELIADRTHINNSAFKVMYIEQIPRNDSGKTLYTELP